MPGPSPAGSRGIAAPAARRTSCACWPASTTTSRPRPPTGCRCTSSHPAGCARTCRQPGRWPRSWGPAGLALRMPSWASDVMIILNGRRCQLDPHGDGYLRLTRNWSAGDELTAEFAMPVRAVRADPRLDAVRGCVAFERGPLVYCVESPDLPGHARLDDLAITPDGAGQAGRAARLAAADIA